MLKFVSLNIRKGIVVTIGILLIVKNELRCPFLAIYLDPMQRERRGSKVVDLLISTETIGLRYYELTEILKEGIKISLICYN